MIHGHCYYNTLEFSHFLMKYNNLAGEISERDKREKLS